MQHGYFEVLVIIILIASADTIRMSADALIVSADAIKIVTPLYIVDTHSPQKNPEKSFRSFSIKIIESDLQKLKHKKRH